MAALISWLRSTKKDDEFTPPGLTNNGNTCFRNVIIQSLSACPSFVDYLSKLISLNNDDGKVAFLMELFHLIDRLNTQSQAMQVPRLLNINSETMVSLRGSNGQHDSHEYFQRLLERIQQDHSRILPRRVDTKGFGDAMAIPNRKQVYTNLNIDKALSETIKNPLNGLIGSNVKCDLCGYIGSLNTEVSTSITLCPSNSGSSVSIDSLLKNRFTIENLLDYKCEKCKETHTKIHRSSFICKYPQILCIHLNRSVFLPNGHIQKNNIHITFNECLRLVPSRFASNLDTFLRNVGKFQHDADLPVNFSDAVDRAKRLGREALVTYQLKSFITHIGTHEHGHFIAYKRLDDGRWFELSDCDVSEITNIDKLLKSSEKSIYMLFYEKDYSIIINKS